jgi:hypothetical protein
VLLFVVVAAAIIAIFGIGSGIYTSGVLGGADDMYTPDTPSRVNTNLSLVFGNNSTFIDYEGPPTDDGELVVDPPNGSDEPIDGSDPDDDYPDRDTDLCEVYGDDIEGTTITVKYITDSGETIVEEITVPEGACTDGEGPPDSGPGSGGGSDSETNASGSGGIGVVIE